MKDPFQRIGKHPLGWALLALVWSAMVSAEEPPATDTTALVNKAAMQRMLSQRIAKAYFYLGNRIRISESRRQLAASRKAFRDNLTFLQQHVDDPQAKEVLAFVAFAFEEYDELTARPYDPEEAALVLDLSETLLETSNELVKRLEARTGHEENRLIDLAGSQRMLAQRIAKYYIAYQAGFRDSHSVHQLRKAVEAFEGNLALLTQSPENSPATAQLLQKIANQWRIIKRFFLTIEKGGIPAMVMVAADRITELSDQVTKLYLQRRTPRRPSRIR